MSEKILTDDQKDFFLFIKNIAEPASTGWRGVRGGAEELRQVLESSGNQKVLMSQKSMQQCFRCMEQLKKLDSK